MCPGYKLSLAEASNSWKYVCVPTILDKINGTFGPPLPPFQWCQNGALLAPSRLHHCFGGMGDNCSILYCPRLQVRLQVSQAVLFLGGWSVLLIKTKQGLWWHWSSDTSSTLHAVVGKPQEQNTRFSVLDFNLESNYNWYLKYGKQDQFTFCDLVQLKQLPILQPNFAITEKFFSCMLV